MGNSEIAVQLLKILAVCEAVDPQVSQPEFRHHACWKLRKQTKDCGFALTYLHRCGMIERLDANGEVLQPTVNGQGRKLHGCEYLRRSDRCVELMGQEDWEEVIGKEMAMQANTKSKSKSNTTGQNRGKMVRQVAEILTTWNDDQFNTYYDYFMARFGQEVANA